jgi:hypothetical protein
MAIPPLWQVHSYIDSQCQLAFNEITDLTGIQKKHRFCYHENSNLVFDPNYDSWETTGFTQHDWTEFHKDAHEAIPPNAPPLHGRPVQMNAFVDANHAGNHMT